MIVAFFVGCIMGGAFVVIVMAIAAVAGKESRLEEEALRRWRDEQERN